MKNYLLLLSVLFLISCGKEENPSSDKDEILYSELTLNFEFKNSWKTTTGSVSDFQLTPEMIPNITVTLKNSSGEEIGTFNVEKSNEMYFPLNIKIEQGTYEIIVDDELTDEEEELIQVYNQVIIPEQKTNRIINFEQQSETILIETSSWVIKTEIQNDTKVYVSSKYILGIESYYEYYETLYDGLTYNEEQYFFINSSSTISETWYSYKTYLPIDLELDSLFGPYLFINSVKDYNPYTIIDNPTFEPR